MRNGISVELFDSAEHRWREVGFVAGLDPVARRAAAELAAVYLGRPGPQLVKTVPCPDVRGADLDALDRATSPSTLTS